jgi:branched-chain amino acid transport system ATP-binding protein
MAEPLLRVNELVKHFGGLIATNNLTLDVHAKEFHAVIGPNGAGKTTLIAQISGELAQESGTIHFAGVEISHLAAPARIKLGLARTFQITQLLNDYSALDNVALAVQARLGHSFHFWSDAREDQALRGPQLTISIGSGSAFALVFRLENCLTASISSLNWRSRSPPVHACCCWTSRWPGLAPPKAPI